MPVGRSYRFARAIGPYDEGERAEEMDDLSIWFLRAEAADPHDAHLIDLRHPL